ncbi:MAG: transcriptional repressor [Bacillota bacterium]|nr:transcriptional repressor [Bacillota bacterium]
MKNRQIYEEDLNNCGLKKTKHRMAILDILDKNEQPRTAEDIFAALQARKVSINLSTVYRTLDILVTNRLLNRLSISQDGRALHEYNRRVHRHYLVCIGCHKIVPIDGCPLEDYSRKLEVETNYVISGHKLDLYGYCPECRTKENHSGHRPDCPRSC